MSDARQQHHDDHEGERNQEEDDHDEGKEEFLSCLKSYLDKAFGNEDPKLYNKARLLMFSTLVAIEGEAQCPSYRDEWWPVHHDFSEFTSEKEVKSP